MLTEKMASETLSIPEIFRLGWSVYRNNLLTILYLLLSIQVPITITDYFMENFGWLITAPLSLLMPMGIAYVVESQITGQMADIKDVYAKLLSVWVAGICAYILSMLIILGMTLLLIIPGLVWSIYYVFFEYAVVLRGKRWKEALDYSKSLVKGRWWKVLGYSIVFSLIYFPFVMIYVLGENNLVVSVTSMSIAKVVGTYSTVLFVLLFLNLDYVRKSEDIVSEKQPPDVIPQFIRPEILEGR